MSDSPAPPAAPASQPRPRGAAAGPAAVERLLALVDLAEASGLASFHYRDEELSLELGPAPAPAGPAPLPAPAAAAAAHPAPPAPAPAPPPAGHPVVSPITGTFYRSASPGAPPYVNQGDAVASGQTLCIVEAMKLMNEIKADRAGRIARILPANEEVVKQGDTLFLLEE